MEWFVTAQTVSTLPRVPNGAPTHSSSMSREKELICFLKVSPALNCLIFWILRVFFSLLILHPRGVFKIFVFVSYTPQKSFLGCRVSDHTPGARLKERETRLAGTCEGAGVGAWPKLGTPGRWLDLPWPGWCPTWGSPSRDTGIVRPALPSDALAGPGRVVRAPPWSSAELPFPCCELFTRDLSLIRTPHCTCKDSASVTGMPPALRSGHVPRGLNSRPQWFH